MSDYIQENRRAMIMLVVALCIALLGGLYLLLSGGTEEELPPVAHGQTQQPAQPAEQVGQTEQSEAVITTAVVRGTGGDPFGPLSGTEEDVADPSPSDSPSPKPTQNTPSKDTSASSDSQGNTSTKPPDVSGSQDRDQSTPAPEKTVVPKPITRADDSVSVRVLQVGDEYVVARVEGDRTRLYLNVPGVHDVVYHAQLGGDCAWLGRATSEERVTVCKGVTQEL